MDFIGDYSDEEEAPVKDTRQAINDTAEQVEYEDFNYPEEPGAKSDSDSDDEFGPKPAEVSSAVSQEVVVSLSPDEIFDQFTVKHQIPIACEVSLPGHTKAVTAASIEPAGNRVVTGSMDYNVKMFDFGGMDVRHRAFSSIEVQDGNPVVSISHSPSGDRFIVATASSQPKVYDREGHDIITFVKGDMYLRDLTHTKGHTMSVTSVCWHPTEKQFLASSSLDGTVRLWDLQGEAVFGNLINCQVLRPTQDKSLATSMSSGQQRTAVTTCSFTPRSGRRLLAGLSNGSVVQWQLQSSGSRKYHYTALTSVWKPPTPSSVLSLTISPDESHVAVRYAAGTVLVWSMSQGRVVQRCEGMDAPEAFPMANVAFSPDGRLICCAALMPVTEEEQAEAAAPPSSSAVAPRRHVTGRPRLYFFHCSASADDSTPVSASELPPAEPALAISLGTAGQMGITIKWHAPTNQIFVTMSHGCTKVFFDPAMIPGDNKRRGAVLSSQRAPKREKDPQDFCLVGEIINPNALPMYRQANHPAEQRKRKVAQLKDPVLAKIPEKPSKQGPGSRPNTSFFFTNYVMQAQDGQKKEDLRAQDPREALLKYAETTQSDPRYLGRAYAQTQPQAKLHEQTFEEERESFKKRQKTL